MKISVIIPTFNGEKYISHTLDSVLSQTYTNIEVILIDDFSSDKTVPIIEKYAKNDTRIKIIKRDKKAYNAVKSVKLGVENSSGDFYFYMSQDDIIDYDLFEKMVARAIETGAEAVIPNMILYYEGKENKDGIFPKNNDYGQIISGKEAFKHCLFWEIHGFYLRKLDILKKINWNENLFAGDEIVSRTYLYNCKKIAFVNSNFYYRQDNKNAMTKVLCPNILEINFNNIYLLKFILENNISKEILEKWLKTSLSYLKSQKIEFEKCINHFSFEDIKKIKEYMKQIKFKYISFLIKLGKIGSIFKVLKYTNIKINNKKTFIHPYADVQSKFIGADTKIWQFCVVLKNASIGYGCNICSNCFIENNVKIGNNVTIKNGVNLYDGIVIEDNVFIGPNAVFCNDKYPKSKNTNFKLEPILIKKGASIGANATILPGITIGENALIAAGAVVTKDVKDGSIYK